MPTGAPIPPWAPCGSPRAVVRSARLRPAARTLTSTSLGFGRGCGISRTTSPSLLATPAFIALSLRSHDPEKLRVDFALIHGHVRPLGDIGPLAGLAREERAELGRRADPRLGAEARRQVLHLGTLEAVVDHAVELADDGRGRSRRRHHAGQ